MTSDGAGGSLVNLVLPSAVIHNEAEFDTLANAVALLPANAGISLNESLAGAGATLTLSSVGGSNGFRSLPAGDSLHLTGATGITVASGADAVIGGANTFSGGVTLQAGATAELVASTSAGTGSIVFQGIGTLVVDTATAPSNAIDFDTTGRIDLEAVAHTGAPSVAVLAADDELTVGSAVLHFGSGATPGALFVVSSDGSGGSLVQLELQSAVVHNEAEFDTVANSVGLLAANAGISVNESLSGAGAMLTLTSAGDSDGFRNVAAGDAAAPDRGDRHHRRERRRRGDRRRQQFYGRSNAAGGRTVELVQATSAGTGSIDFQGNGTLVVDTATGPLERHRLRLDRADRSRGGGLLRVALRRRARRRRRPHRRLGGAAFRLGRVAGRAVRRHR